MDDAFTLRYVDEDGKERSEPLSADQAERLMIAGDGLPDLDDVIDDDDTDVDD